MYTAGPEPIRFATDRTPFARPSARLIAPTRTMHANAIAHAVARVRRVKRVASRKIGRAMRPPAAGWAARGSTFGAARLGMSLVTVRCQPGNFPYRASRGYIRLR